MLQSRPFSREAATATAEAVAAAAPAAGPDQGLPPKSTTAVPQTMVNSAACLGSGILTNAHVAPLFHAMPSATDGSAMVSVVNAGPAHPLHGVMEATIQSQAARATAPFANRGRPKMATNLSSYDLPRTP